jgi:hypothetical protein
MKRFFLIICLFFFFFSLIIYANAGELYRCKDGQGNTMVTDNPQSGMKCEYFNSQSSSEEPSEQKKADEKKDTEADIIRAKQERVLRINQCIKCCNDKVLSCYNYTADNRLCRAENQSCASMCKSEGSSTSSWSNCWSQSK